jgi:centromeric protein E
LAASIFAYGQTSSGKTYTMMGITEYSMLDIYDYIDRVFACFSFLSFLEHYCVFTSLSLYLNPFSMLQHPEREFILKFSAIEIYNEAVRDLLSHDPTPLRLLDDPEVLYSSLLQLTITWVLVFHPPIYTTVHAVMSNRKGLL